MIVSKDIGRRTRAALAIAGAVSMTALGMPSTAASHPIEIRISDGLAAFIDLLELVSETVLWLPHQFGYGQ